MSEAVHVLGGLTTLEAAELRAEDFDPPDDARGSLTQGYRRRRIRTASRIVPVPAHGYITYIDPHPLLSVESLSASPTQTHLLSQRAPERVGVGTRDDPARATEGEAGDLIRGE